MKVLIPTTFTPAMLIASNTVEAYPTWAAGTTYAKDARVDYGIDIYQSLVNSNTGNQPDTSPLSWLLVGPDNKHAMFDNEIGTVTTSPAPLSVTVATGVIEAVYLGNVTAARATVTVQNGAGGPVVYQSTQSLAGDEVADWYQYFFFDPLTQRTQAFFQGIPLVLNSHLTIELEGSGSVSIGTVSFDRLRTLGTVAMGAQAGIRDYSRKETDEFGVTTFVQRAFSKRLSAQFAVDRTQLNRVQRQLYGLRATPVVWLGADDAPEYEEALTIFGFYRDFTTAIDYPTYSLCNIEIEGLI